MAKTTSRSRGKTAKDFRRELEAEHKRMTRELRRIDAALAAMRGGPNLRPGTRKQD